MLHSLITRISRSFSVHNYMKQFQADIVSRRHGRMRVDEHHHLKDNKRVLSRLERDEKTYFNKARENWKHMTEEYEGIVKQRTIVGQRAIPQEYDHYTYHTKINWLQQRQYSTIHRTKKDSDKQELVLDIMKMPILKKHYKTVELVKTAFNQQQNLMFFACDLKNNEQVRWWVKDLNNNSTFQENFQDPVKNVVFLDDLRILFVVEDGNKRPNRVYLKQIGQKEKTLLYEEKDPEYFLDIHPSKDRSCVFITANTKTNCEVYLVDKTAKLTKIFCRSLKSRAFVNGGLDNLYLWTDADGSHDFKVVKVDRQLKRYDYHLPKQNEIIYQVDLFKKYMVLYMKNISKSFIRVINLENKEIHEVPLAETVCSIVPGANEGYDVQKITFYVSTPLKYNTCYSYNLKTKLFKILDEPKFAGSNFDSNAYRVHVVQAESETGDTIPITIIEPKKRNGPTKLLLHAYGFYGLGNEPHYNNVYLQALERGWIIAYAHVRGGNEKGKKWWQQGILNKKSRAWKDLHECVAYLLKQEYTHPALLVLYGGSAGAITVWNEINKHPYLYKAAILHYPFLDVLSTLMDESLPLTISDHAEFGNPNNSLAEYNTIESYCPYETIRKQEYPALLIHAGKNDYRCPLYQIMKFTQRFRERAVEPTRFEPLSPKGLLVNVHKDGSHLGITDQHDTISELCEMFGYLDHLIDERNRDATLQ